MADIITGGDGTDGKVSVQDKGGRPVIELLAAPPPGVLRIFNRNGVLAAVVSEGGLTLGGPGLENGSNGQLVLQSKGSEDQIILSVTGGESRLLLGGRDRPGRLIMHSGKIPSPNSVDINAADGTLRLDGGPTNGTLSVLGKDGEEHIQLIVTDRLTRIDVGTNGRPGSLVVRGRDGFAAFSLETRGNESLLLVGRDDQPGRLVINNSQNDRTVQMTGDDATLQLGGAGTNGTVSVRGKDGQPLIELLGRDNESVIGLGQANRPGRISLFSGSQQETLRLDGASGDIVLMNADCAEEFDLAQSRIEPQPGTVMVLTDGGSVVPSDKPYDTRVAGVVSGAGSFRPGLILDRRDTGAERAPIALVGKVYCQVDATDAPVQVGDLLTTAQRAGHAMRILDPTRAFGAVLGKALSPLASGRVDLIPILVALQ